jgi:hypothetical protein
MYYRISISAAVVVSIVPCCNTVEMYSRIKAAGSLFRKYREEKKLFRRGRRHELFEVCSNDDDIITIRISNDFIREVSE